MTWAWVGQEQTDLGMCFQLINTHWPSVLFNPHVDTTNRERKEKMPPCISAWLHFVNCQPRVPHSLSMAGILARNERFVLTNESSGKWGAVDGRMGDRKRACWLCTSAVKYLEYMFCVCLCLVPALKKKKKKAMVINSISVSRVLMCFASCTSHLQITTFC